MKAKPKTKPSLTARERVLLLALPAVLGIAIYAAAVNPKHIARLNGARAKLAKAELERSRGPQIVMTGAALDAELAKLRGEKAKLEQQVAAFQGEAADPTQRTEALVAVSQVLRRHELSVIEEGPTAGNPVATRAPQKPANAAAIKAGAWRIRFIGGYGNVLTALREVQALDAPCFPQSLTMAEPRAGADWRDWTLTLRL